MKYCVLELGDGTGEEYIYYECSVTPPHPEDYGPVIIGDDGAFLDPACRGELLRFVKRGNTVEMDGLNGDDVMEILCDWAGGTMKSNEISVMWRTREGWIFEGSWQGDTLPVFPPPASSVHSLSGIPMPG